MASNLPVEDDPGPCRNEYEPSPAIEPQRFFHINHREARERNQCNDFKDDLDPGRRLDVVAVTVGRERSTVVNRGDVPQREDDQQQSLVLERQMSIPSQRHNTLDAGR